MNRRQAKKKLKAEYGITTPRQTSPRLCKRYTLRLAELIGKKIAETLDKAIIEGANNESEKV